MYYPDENQSPKNRFIENVDKKNSDNRVPQKITLNHVSKFMSPDNGSSPSRKKFFAENDAEDFTTKSNLKKHDKESKLQVVEEMKNQEREKLESVRESKVGPLPMITPKPVRDSTMRNVLSPVNRIQSKSSQQGKISDRGSAMFHQENKSDGESTQKEASEAMHSQLKKHNRFSHTGVGVSKGVSRVDVLEEVKK